MRSMYGGESEGIEFNDMMAQRDEDQQARRDQANQAIKQKALDNQAQMHAAQVAANSRPTALSAEPPDGPEPVYQHGERVTASSAPDLTKEHGDLVNYIKGVAMGNPLQAEQSFGLAKPGSSKFNEDRSIDFESIEGHPVHIPSKDVDYHVHGEKYPLEKTAVPLTEKDKAEIEKIKAETEAIKAGKSKPLTALQEATLASKNMDMDAKNQTREEDIYKTQKEANDAKKELDVATETARNGGWFGGKIEDPEQYSDKDKKAIATAQSKLDDATQRLAIKSKKEVVPSTQPAAPAQPSSSNPRTAVLPTKIPITESTAITPEGVVEKRYGLGTSPNGIQNAITVTRPVKKVATVRDAYNLIATTIKTGKHPDTGNPLELWELDQAKRKLSELKNRLPHEHPMTPEE